VSSFNAQVTTAFTVAEVLQHARLLESDLDDVAGDFDASEPRDDLKALREIVEFWTLVGNSAWVPRLLDIPRQWRLKKLIEETPLYLHRNPLASREESISAVSPGIVGNLRERVTEHINKGFETSEGRYVSVSDLALWEELAREGSVDYAFRSVRPGFEIRVCAQCGKWYEPQLSNRSRFCSQDCRKRFNNIRNSAREEVKNFTCKLCGQKRSMELFSGLRYSDDESEDIISPLRIAKYSFYPEDRCCTDCVQSRHPEWARYIAPLVEAKDSKDRAVTA